MNSERWRQVEELYHAALLNRAVLEGVDPGLRREVESLLAQDGSLPEHPGDPMITPGAQLGPYRIEALLGEGGMGQVFRATDTRLGRAVAIKTSHERLNPRFEREARAISSLNHPNICTLYDVGPDYLVMELCEGETLAARLGRGKLSLDDTLRIGIQIADALAAAHAKGVTHRDLKPGNIIITRTGAKVLDFGLARSPEDETLTASRALMGTPAYMAPEQREGKHCDARTDIYSFGLVLSEMAAGKRGSLEGVPAHLAHVIERCLAPEPDNRWQSAGDIKGELEWTRTAQPALAARGSIRKLPRWLWVVAILACAGWIGVAVLWLRPARQPIGTPSQFTLSLGDEVGNAVWMAPAPSPDGRFVVFAARASSRRPLLGLRALDSSQSRELPGTDGVEGFFWSPDSRWVGFFADGKLKKVGPNGGPPQTIATLPALQEAAWSSTGDILFRPSNREPLFRIPASGGAPVPVTYLDKSRTENSHRGLQFLPDGRRFLFTARCGQRENNALYLGSLDSTTPKRILPVDSNVSYLPPENDRPGLLVYYKDSGLVAQAFDPDRAAVSGEPYPVVNDVAYNASGIAAYFRTSADGRVAAIRPAGADQTQLTWFERNGEESGTLGPRGAYGQPRISPDGSRVLFTQPDPQTGNRDLFLIEIARGVRSRLTTHVANDWFAVWSPDGKQILFGSDRDGGTSMLTYLKKSMDPGSGETRFPGAGPVDWSRDGRWIVLDPGDRDVEVAPAAADGKPFPYLATRFREKGGRFSPDGKWMAYVSDETGRGEVYVRPFTGAPASGEGKLQISSSGGNFVVWKPDGQELYYMSPDQSIYAVDTRNLGRSQPAPPVPVKLFEACPGRKTVGPPGQNTSYNYSYDTHDGKRFLVNCAVEQPGRYLVLLNWPFEKKQ